MGCIRVAIAALVLSAGPLLAGPSPTVTPTPTQRQAPVPEMTRMEEIAALRQELGRLRQRLQAHGQAEAGRRERRWWDLPKRRHQEFRLRRLRHWREQLEEVQFRLMQLERENEEEAEKPLQDN